MLDSKRSDEKNAALWKLLAEGAKGSSEQESVIRALVMNSATNTTTWARTILKQFEETAENDRVSDLAGKGLAKMDSLAEGEEEDNEDPAPEE